MILTWGFFSLIDLDVYNMMQPITQFRQIIDLVRSCSEPTIYFSRQYRSIQQEAQLMLTTGSMRLAVIRCQQTCRDLEIGVRGHSRSSKVLSVDRPCMVSY